MWNHDFFMYRLRCFNEDIVWWDRVGPGGARWRTGVLGGEALKTNYICPWNTENSESQRNENVKIFFGDKLKALLIHHFPEVSLQNTFNESARCGVVRNIQTISFRPRRTSHQIR